MTHENILVCMKVSEIEPNLQSRVGTCTDCGSAIWIALSNPDNGARPLCVTCAEKVLKKFDPKTIKVQPPSEEQIKDIVESFKE